MRMILSGFMGSISAERPTNTIGPRAGFGRYQPDGLANAIGRTASSGGPPGDDSQAGPSPIAVGFPQHADQPGPDVRSSSQSISSSAKTALWVVPELADTVGSLEVGEHEDVEKLGAGSGTQGVQALA
jgi:hypothetical protein